MKNKPRKTPKTRTKLSKIIQFGPSEGGTIADLFAVQAMLSPAKKKNPFDTNYTN